MSHDCHEYRKFISSSFPLFKESVCLVQICVVTFLWISAWQYIYISFNLSKLKRVNLLLQFVFCCLNVQVLIRQPSRGSSLYIYRSNSRIYRFVKSSTGSLNKMESSPTNNVAAQEKGSAADAGTSVCRFLFPF